MWNKRTLDLGQKYNKQDKDIDSKSRKYKLQKKSIRFYKHFFKTIK